MCRTSVSAGRYVIVKTLWRWERPRLIAYCWDSFALIISLGGLYICRGRQDGDFQPIGERGLAGRVSCQKKKLGELDTIQCYAYRFVASLHGAILGVFPIVDAPSQRIERLFFQQKIMQFRLGNPHAVQVGA